MLPTPAGGQCNAGAAGGEEREAGDGQPLQQRHSGERKVGAAHDVAVTEPMKTLICCRYACLTCVWVEGDWANKCASPLSGEVEEERGGSPAQHVLSRSPGLEFSKKGGMVAFNKARVGVEAQAGMDKVETGNLDRRVFQFPAK
ncbi:hypothetical protein P691DRAFT_787941 [Macrolepiota fuliginosa MF-IS2]|uniref:Uncharacterized protein n=1 Tax=Macrolepiota fuliginosa MF-IS2 TaxID=1400762 RepID=A0A9P5X351_9AGAR|nr:hypothetical protein P691DRAFT_787941 [Macrolepiota fuliginosa MF-IS2]